MNCSESAGCGFDSLEYALRRVSRLYSPPAAHLVPAPKQQRARTLHCSHQSQRQTAGTHYAPKKLYSRLLNPSHKRCYYPGTSPTHSPRSGPRTKPTPTNTAPDPRIRPCGRPGERRRAPRLGSPKTAVRAEKCRGARRFGRRLHWCPSPSGVPSRGLGPGAACCASSHPPQRLRGSRNKEENSPLSRWGPV